MNHEQIIGLHLPKCAGTSLLRSIEKLIPSEEIYQVTSFHKNYFYRMKEFYEISDWKQVKAIFGHHVVDEMVKFVKNPYLFTFVREPISRHISNFRYNNRLRQDLKHPELSFDEYAENEDNDICSFILFRFPAFDRKKSLSRAERVAGILGHFDYVGDSDELISSCLPSTIGEILGCGPIDIGYENVSPNAKHNETSEDEELIGNIKARYSDEIELYSIYLEGKSRGDGLSFLDAESVMWRKSEFMFQPLDFSSINARLIPFLYWEYRNFGLIGDFLASIPETVSFLNSFLDYCDSNP